MNDHSFELREIKAMFHDWKKWSKGKESLSEISDGEWAECIINGIHSGKIHTISSPYDDDDIFEGMPIVCSVENAKN